MMADAYDQAIDVLAQVFLCGPGSSDQGAYQKARIVVAALDKAGLIIAQKTEIVVTLRLDATQVIAELLHQMQQLNGENRHGEAASEKRATA